MKYYSVPERNEILMFYNMNTENMLTESQTQKDKCEIFKIGRLIKINMVGWVVAQWQSTCLACVRH